MSRGGRGGRGLRHRHHCHRTAPYLLHHIRHWRAGGQAQREGGQQEAQVVGAAGDLGGAPTVPAPPGTARQARLHGRRSACAQARTRSWGAVARGCGACPSGAGSAAAQRRSSQRATAARRLRPKHTCPHLSNQHVGPEHASMLLKVRSKVRDLHLHGLILRQPPPVWAPRAARAQAAPRTSLNSTVRTNAVLSM